MEQMKWSVLESHDDPVQVFSGQVFIHSEITSIFFLSFFFYLRVIFFQVGEHFTDFFF